MMKRLQNCLKAKIYDVIAQCVYFFEFLELIFFKVGMLLYEIIFPAYLLEAQDRVFFRLEVFVH